MPNPVPIRVEGLSHYFGSGALRKQVLFDITAQIPEGEIVIVTGPSGSGKTTLLTIVSALRSVQEGSVQVLGEELNGAAPAVLERVRRGIGFIFQHHNLLLALTALQNVELGLRPGSGYTRSAARKRAAKFLEVVGLGDSIHQKPGQLSGGQRQRIAIARALISEPPVLMADEPTASLDGRSGREVVDLMKTMAKERGSTILLVTHDNRILDIADRIVYLEDGRLSTFTDAVIDNSQQMMQVIQDVPEHAPLGGVTVDFDFQYMLVDISLQAQRLLALRGKVNEMAYRSIVSDGIRGFIDRLCEMLDADGGLLLVADTQQELLVAFTAGVAHPDSPSSVSSRQGIAGATLSDDRIFRLEDVTAEPLFDAEIDGRMAPGVRSMISMPVHDGENLPFAVFQLHRRGSEPFTAEAELKTQRFIDTIGILLKALQEILKNVPDSGDYERNP